MNFEFDLNVSNKTEDELKPAEQIELVTSAPDSEDNIDEADPKDTRHTVGGDIEDENEDLDYDGSTDADLMPSSTASSYPNYPTNQCRADDIIECPGNSQYKICKFHLCDGIAHCPDEADENPENCRHRGESQFAHIKYTLRIRWIKPTFSLRILREFYTQIYSQHFKKALQMLSLFTILLCLLNLKL